MMHAIADKKIGTASFFVLLTITTFMPQPCINALQNFSTLAAWATHCFKQLPENPSNAPLSVTTDEVSNLFDTYRTILATSELNNASNWVNGGKPNCVAVTPITTTGNLNDDRSEPFVRAVTIPELSTVCFMGDLHGSVHALTRNLMRLHAQGFISNEWKLTKPNNYLFFLGDIVDVGKYGLACWCLLMKLFNENPDNVMLVRGNHEEHEIWQSFGFKTEAQRLGTTILFQFKDFCMKLPLALFVQHRSAASSVPTWVQCCHGGIEPRFDTKKFLESSCPYTQATMDYPENFINETFNPGETFSAAGFNYSSFTGASPTENYTTNYSRTINGNRWHLNDYYKKGTTIARSCYLTDIPETQTYLSTTGLSAFFRGHDDRGDSFKLIENNQPFPQKWDTVLGSRSLATLQSDGVPMSFFLNKSTTIPVFTLTTATEARHLPNEGFCLVETNAQFADWVIKPHIYQVNIGADAYTSASVDFSLRSAVFTHHTNSHDAPVTLLGNQPELTTTTDCASIVQQLITLQESLVTLQQKLTDLKNLLTSLKTEIEKNN